MIAFRGQRPFSIDRKVPDVDRFLPPGRRPCELRLLATTTDVRNGFVFRGLVDLMARHAIGEGYDLAVISGTVRQTRLYQHLGFVPFGNLIGSDDARYQPMYLTLEAFREQFRVFATPVVNERERKVLNFLPGPVTMHPDVVAAFHRTPVSCRSAAFVRDFHATRRELCQLVHARHVQILMGSGTVANDAIAAELSSRAEPGIILSNGAFGERLIDHAARFGLPFRAVERPWGAPFEADAIVAALEAEPGARWLWGVHGETSTGMLNDLEQWRALCSARQVALCIDAISTLGSTPLDLRGVALASAVSGKGLGAFPGLAFVFHDAPPRPASTRQPRYLDLGYYAACDGIPFTISSNLVHATQAAVQRIGAESRWARIGQLSRQLRHGLRALGLVPVATASPFPAVTTIAVPREQDSLTLGQALAEAGFLLHYHTPALMRRNWIQVCFMGHTYPPDAVDALLRALGSALRRSPSRSRLDSLGRGPIPPPNGR
jgi:aspartate aminotransferase-like enzyme